MHVSADDDVWLCRFDCFSQPNASFDEVGEAFHFGARRMDVREAEGIEEKIGNTLVINVGKRGKLIEL